MPGRSPGLPSLHQEGLEALAAGLLRELGVEFLGLNFSTGFCKVDHRRAINDPGEDPERLRNPALQVGAMLGFPVEILDVATAYLEVVRNPRYGYGANVNPGIGRAMDTVERDAGLEGRLLRPLSARFLPPTLPARDGRLDRHRQKKDLSYFERGSGK